MAASRGKRKPGAVAAKDAVTIAYVHPTEVAYSWVHCLIQLSVADLTTSRRVATGGFIAMSCNAGQVAESRNRAVEVFLNDGGKADWLLWLDTDMGFLPDLAERLLEQADPVARPIVGALCFSQRQIANDDLGGFHTYPTPTIFDWVERDGLNGFDIRYDYPVDALVPCDGTGSAAVLIHRSVFERVHAEYGPTWYDPIRAKEGRVGEDLSFCMRAGAVDAPVHVHTGIRTTHYKHVWLSEQDFYDQSAVPPATQEVAVIVPVLERADQAEPFMVSLRASTGLARVLAMCDAGDRDAIAAWKEAGAEVHEGDYGERPGTFAEKVNAGMDQVHEPWVLLVGSDVEFHAGWLNHALDVAGDRYAVVGTNDLGNPRVTTGQHSTHPLIRTAYVREYGASWDGPGIVACEEYRHWYVDDEIVQVAKDRGVWAMALASKVEHLHPLWGKGTPDAVYTLGEQHMDKDRAVFERRMREHRRP